jgi:hypothetical protein
MSDAEGGITVGGSGADDSGTLKSGAIGSDTIVGASYQAGTGGSITPSWTQASNGYAVVAFNVNAAAGGGSAFVPYQPAYQNAPVMAQ